MSLTVVATPIGNWADITLRAVDILKSCDLVIGEERKEASKLLKFTGVGEKPIELLNEHSTDAEVVALARMCVDRSVCLVSDCGTPGFCDPGARLIVECRKLSVTIVPLPGPSSLMTLLSVAGLQLRQFNFVGFLPAEKEARAEALADLFVEDRSQVLVDTPYRLIRLMDELIALKPQARAVLGLDLTLPTEKILAGPISEIRARLADDLKAEFILLLEGDAETSVAARRVRIRERVREKSNSAAAQQSERDRARHAERVARNNERHNPGARSFENRHSRKNSSEKDDGAFGKDKFEKNRDSARPARPFPAKGSPAKSPKRFNK